MVITQAALARAALNREIVASKIEGRNASPDIAILYVCHCLSEIIRSIGAQFQKDTLEQGKKGAETHKARTIKHVEEALKLLGSAYLAYTIRQSSHLRMDSQNTSSNRHLLSAV